MKPVLVSGIQPTGRLHIGNYLGALKNFVELQNSGKYQCYFFIADLHALTENPEAKNLHENIKNLAADFIAVGLNPKKSVIFQQSKIPAHSELWWILSIITPPGELERMTQFKDKSRKQIENINAGLLYYPVLMASDILLYDAEGVPTGDDQDQHLELARTLARKFNTRFGKTFKEPKNIHTAAPRIMDLRVPGKKMSKSDPMGCLFIDDSPEEIRSKIMSATTDSHAGVQYDKFSSPGMSNLLEIYSALSGKKIDDIVSIFSGKGYAEFKKSLAETISDYFADFRKKKKTLLSKPSGIKSILAAGSRKANLKASKKITEVKKKVGLI
ncbi:MAG: tryptophan--tRNA ligase [Patescibacteria group bacterium]